MAEELSIGIETLRYYEKLGLIPLPDRDKNGYRVFSEDYMPKLKFIVIAKKYGFSLKEIHKFVDIVENRAVQKNEIKLVLNDKIKNVEHQIKELGELKKLLFSLAQSDKVGECNTFQSLMKNIT